MSPSRLSEPGRFGSVVGAKGNAAMNIILISYFGSLVMFVVNPPGALSRRLTALRGWPSHKNRLSIQ
jgi:hypothetical protein